MLFFPSLLSLEVYKSFSDFTFQIIRQYEAGTKSFSIFSNNFPFTFYPQASFFSSMSTDVLKFSLLFYVFLTFSVSVFACQFFDEDLATRKNGEIVAIHTTSFFSARKKRSRKTRPNVGNYVLPSFFSNEFFVSFQDSTARYRTPPIGTMATSART